SSKFLVMRLTVPVPIPSALTTFKIPTSFASCFRTLRCLSLAGRVFPPSVRRCCTYNARALLAGPRKDLPWLRLHQPVSRSDLPEERCAQLRRALLVGIVDVEKPETGAEAGGPLEIVHQAPMEIAAHRHALGRRALQLRQVATQEHDAVCVVDEAVGGRHVGR